MTDSLAPIALFVYNRLEHAQYTLDALKKNLLAEQSELFIFSDGPRKEEDIAKVKKVREYINQITGFYKVIIKERENNYGLEKSVVEGVTEVIGKYGKVIVLEDDLITHKYFLKYMNEGLNIYRDNKKVYSITGYSYLRKTLKEYDTYFLKLTSSWSWATWKDRWDQYDSACEGWEILKKNSLYRKKFDYDFGYPFYRLLDTQLKDDKINSWAIKWYWTVFKNGGLTLYPQVSLVDNAGFDGSGVHCSSKQKNAQKFIGEFKTGDISYEIEIRERVEIRNQVTKDLRKGLGLSGRLQIIKDMIG